MRSDKYADSVSRLKIKHETATQIYRKEKQTLASKKAQEESALKAQQLLQQASQIVQQAVHGQIATIVSRCLETVFDEPYDFQVLFEQKRGRTQARLVFYRDGEEIDPMTASGGGVVDVGSFAMRLASLLLSKPRKRRLLILDEPFKFVSEEYRERVRGLLESLSKDFDVQVILVTHIEELQMGKVVRL
uniref:Putative ATPase domain containing protein n=1 Tax=viral metagenome TaxID=1070528 RepID=A0A6M3JY58_9ZZZZ